MAWGEIFSALQQGTVDGQENPLAIILTAKVYEVQKYITMIDLFYSPCVLMINEDIYNNFTDEQKEEMCIRDRSGCWYCHRSRNRCGH